MIRKKDKQSRFWMVFNTSHFGRAPTYTHETREAADKEAARLARQNPGQCFIVLKSMGGFIAEQPEVQPVKIVARDVLDDIPF